MKNMCKYWVVALSIIFSFGVFSQVPEKLPIGSRPVLMEYAYSRASYVIKGVSTSAQSTDSVGSVVRNILPTATSIKEFFHQSEFSFKTFSTNSPVWAYGYVVDEDNNDIFYGSLSTSIVFRNGSFTLKRTDVDLFLAENTSIKFPGVNFVKIYYTDVDGDKKEEILDWRNGSFKFPSALAGQVDLIIVETYDDESNESKQYAYNGQGVKVDPYNIDTPITFSLPDTQIYKDTSIINYVVKTEGGKGRNPYFELTLSSARTVTFSVTTSEGKHPKYLVYKLGEKDWDYVNLEAGKSFNMRDGLHKFYFIWDEKDFVDEVDPYYPPDDWNGKG